MDGSLPFNSAAANLQEPALFDIRRGNGPVLFLFQHSGFYVPLSLYQNDQPLGLPPEWFDPNSPARRHEASDWGTSELANALAFRAPEASFLRANFSRLIVDLNRKRSATEVIPTTSSEHVDWTIPGNMNLSAEAREHRLREFFDPYHAALAQEIARIKQKYGHVIVVDIHSFTPVWLGVPRPVEIGTLYTAENTLARALNAALVRHAPERFTPNAPYVLADREDNGGHAFEREHKLDYIGLEIRQDLLATQEGLFQTARLITNTVLEVQRTLIPELLTQSYEQETAFT
jgi:predicted N-formylglutamate amidohydrolase